MFIGLQKVRDRGACLSLIHIFSEGSDWTVPRYLAIDQCTIAPLIENYRSGLLWKLFMSCPEVQELSLIHI